MENTAQPFADKIALLKELDPELIRQRAGGRDRTSNNNLVFDYLEWHVVTDILDEHAPSWSSQIKELREMGSIVMCHVAVTIDGVTREGIGTGPGLTEKDIKKAEHDGLKRAALKFGVGRQLYKKQQRADRQSTAPSSQSNQLNAPLGPPPSDPIAKTLPEMITTKQLGMVRAVARDLEVDPDEVSAEVLNAKVSELSRRAASWLIDFIRSDEFKAGASKNVLPMPERNDSPVSPKVAGDLLFQAGAVKPVKDGFEVSQKIKGVPSVLMITSSGDGVACSCGDFKTQVFIKKQMDFQCAHIVAAQAYIAATNGVQASA